MFRTTVSRRADSTYVFDIWAWVHRDQITMLHTEIVSHDTVDASTSIIQVIIRKDNQNGVLAHFTLDQNCIAAEELQRLHRVVGEGNNGVVIVDGVGNAVSSEFSN